MKRVNLPAGCIVGLASVLALGCAAGWSAAQEAPATQPATQPAQLSAEEAREKLRRLLEERQAAQQQEPSRSQPASRPASHPSLEELKHRARLSTQPGSAIAVDTEEDFFGPPHLPAVPIEERRGMVAPSESTEAQSAGKTAEPAAEARKPQETPAAPTRPVSRATASSEWFAFDGVPWEDVVKHFADRIGKPLMNASDLVIGGELTYHSDREFTKEEAIDELNLIMQMVGYRFVETEHHVYVIPLSEMHTHLDPSAVFPSREAFEAASLRPTDYVMVLIHIRDHPARKVQEMFDTLMPDYMTITALEDSNQLKVIGMARDIRKLLDLMDRVPIFEDDPREMKIFSIETNARDIERMVREILDIRPGAAAPRTQFVRDATGKVVPQPVSGAETGVLMSADDRTNTLIVRATPDKLKEIETLIQKIDKRPDLEFSTKVYRIKNANADDVAELLTKILSQEQGAAQMPAWQRAWQYQQWQQQQAAAAAARARRGQVQPQPQPQPQPVPAWQAGVSPEDLLGEGLFERAKKTIRIAPDARTNSIIVYANKDGHKRVEDLLTDLDKAEPSNLRTISLENAKVEQIYPILSQLVQNMAGAAATGRAPSIVPDEGNNQFYVLAEREQMQQIEEVIRRLDVAGPETVRHVIELRNIAPSRVAAMIEPMLNPSTTAATPTPAATTIRRALPGQPAAMPAPSARPAVSRKANIIPLDEAGLLIVDCVEDEAWEKVEQTIRLWDEQAVSNKPEYKAFKITQGDPAAIAATLDNLYRGQYNHPAFGRSTVLVEARGDTVVVYAIRPALEEIAALVEVLDQPDGNLLEILPLAHADATQVAQQLQTLFGGGGGAVAVGPRGAPSARTSGPVISAEPNTNSLIVRADPLTLDRIKAFAWQLDRQVAAQEPERRFFVLRYARAQEVAQHVQNTFAGAPVRRALGGGVGGSGLQVRAFASGAQVIVDAPREKMPEIEEFIRQLDDPHGREVVTRQIRLPGVDVTQAAQNLTQIARSIVRPDGLQAMFIPDPATESITVAAPADMLDRIDEWVSNLTAGAEDLTLERKFYPVKEADAAFVGEQVRQQLAFQVQQKKGANVASRINVGVDPRQNQIVITAPRFVHPLAEELIAALDRPAPDEAPITIQPRYADPNQLAQLINAMYGPGRGVAGQSQQQMVQAQVSNGMLVVKAPRSRQEEIRQLVQAVDAEDTTALQVRTYQLKLLNAAQVAAQVQLYLRSLGGVQRGGQLQPGAFGEPTTNTLVVVAPAQHLPLIESLIDSLESRQGELSAQARTYVLHHARADQVQQNLDLMLKAKVAEREGPVRKNLVQTAVFSDPQGNRLIVFAPPEYHELAAELIRMVDSEIQAGELVRIVRLEKGDAQQIAQTLQQVVQGGGRAARQVRITADVGSNSIVLAGLPPDVAEIEKYVATLEEGADVTPELRLIQVQHVSAEDLAETLRKLFETRGGRASPADAVSITADTSYNRLLVTASRRRMRQVEEFVAELDQPPELPGEGLVDTRGREIHFVKISRGDAFDIAWDVREMLPDEDKGGPSIHSDWEGRQIIVRCRPGEFDRILALIRKFEENAHVEKKVVIRKPRGDVQAMLNYLQERFAADELDVQVAPPQRPASLVESLWGPDEEPDVVRQRRQRDSSRQREENRPRSPQSQQETGTRSDVWPFRLGSELDDELIERLAAELRGQTPPASRPSAPSARSPARTEASASAGSEPVTASLARAAAEPERTRVVVQPDGSVIIYGPRNQVEDIEQVLDLLEEDLDVGEVIRIFEFRYGDVTAAAEVLQLMFNERQMLRMIQPMQPQQQSQQQRGREGAGKEEESRSLLDQLRGTVGGPAAAERRGARGSAAAGGQRIRIATDPAHNYLIVKCNQADLPEIRQLLRELDIPPGEVELKVFQLRNLDATETANNIKEILGISRVQQRRGAAGVPAQPTARGRTAPGANPQAELIEMLQQQLVAVPGVEGGAKVERVEVVPNDVTNSILVSAPPDVMKIIERIITELEGLEARDIVGIYHYQLERARVDDVLPLLQEIFGSAGGRGEAGAVRPRAGAARAGRPGALGPVTISADPRVNTIIFTCEAKDVEIVRAQIRMLDIEGAIAEAETYVCRFGDAQTIAEVIESIYGAGRRTGRPGEAAGAQDIRIAAEPATNAIIVWGPPDKRDEIFRRIEEIDLRSRRDFRQIDVRYADPERLAETLTQMFGGAPATAGAGRRGAGGGPRPAGAAASGSLVIIGDKNARKLLVRAPDPVFRQIEEIVATLDQQNEQMQLRRYALRYADAEFVVDSVKAALADYMQLAGLGRGAGGGQLPFDPFTVVPDPRTNSIIVVGSEQTFAFVQSVLSTIDVETPAEHKKDFRIFVLDKADAETVAAAINEFAAGGGAATGAGARPGTRRGSAGSAAGSAGGPAPRLLDVYAVADTTTNSVLVTGRSEDIDRVQAEVIAPLEDAIRAHLEIATIPVHNVRPSEIVGFIWQFIGGREAQPGQRGTGRPGAPGRGPTDRAPQIIPNDDARTLVVRGSRADIEEIRELVQRFDNRELVATDMKIIPVPLGQNPTDLARDLERAVNESEQIIAEATGRPARQIVVVANEQAKVLMVGGDPALFARVENMVRQFTEIAPQRLVTRVIELRNLSADDAENLSNDLQGRRSGTRSRGGMTPAPSTPSRPRGSGRSSGGGGARPTPGAPPDAGASLLRTPVLVSPCLGLVLLAGSLKAALAHNLVEDVPPAATAESAPATSAPTRPAAAPASAGAQPSQATAPAEEGPTGITGELRGELIVTPIDSKRIIVQGDQADVDFFEQILLMMERSTPPAQIEVFTLRNAKATVLAPIIERAIKGRIDISTPRPGPADKFSINAEGRSNSLIVSASEVIMEQIRELIEKLDVVKPGALTDIRAVPLRHMRAAEAVATLRPTIEKLNRLREVPADSQASIEAVERNNSVLIVGTPKDIEEIQQLLESIDVEIEPTESFVAVDAVLIPVQNAVAEDVAKLLNDMIKAEQEAASQAGGAGGGARAAGRPFVKVIRLRIGDRELPELNLERPIRILPDKGTNSLLIFSTPKNNEALVEMVKIFDTLPAGADTDVRVVALRHASAEEVAKLLKDVFEDKSALQRPSAGDSKKFGKGELPPVPPGLAGKGLPYNLVVQHDARSNTIIVVGRKDAVLLAAGLITELDRPSAELGVKPRVIELKHTSASLMQEKLSKLLDERAKALGVDKNKARDSAVLIPDDRSGYLIVLATPEMFEMIEDLAVQLDAAQTHTVVTTRFCHLKHADAQKLASMLKEVFDKRKTADREQSKDIKDSLEVLPDTRSNSLILTGTRDYLAEAESMISELDRQFDPTVVFKVRPVKLNSAQNIAALLKDMVDKALREQDSRLKGTPIYIAADPLTDSLLLAASAEDMVQLERWVEILDRPSEFGRMVRIIPLRRTSAEEVARAASEIFRRAGGEARGGVDINVTHDASTNSVVAFGPPAVLDDVADFVRRLDETEAGAGVVIRIFNLKQADAEDAGELLSSILELRGGTVGGGRTGGGAGGRREAAKQILLLFQQEHPEFGPSWLKAVRSDISVVADLRTNSLVVTAPPDSMPLMESLISAIDVPPAAAKVRVFALKNADAEQMKRTLTELFERRTTGGAGRAGESQRELTLAETIGGRQEVSFTTDARTNSLIAAGTPGYLDLVEELVMQLDTVPVVERKTMVYAPRNMVAEKLATAIRDWSEQEKRRLQELGEEISLAVRQEAEIGAIPYEDSNRIILTYSPRKEAEVLDIVRQLDQQPAQVSIEVLIVEVSMGNTLELGFEFAFQDLQYAKAGPQDTTTFDFVGGTDIGAAGAGLGGFTFTITGRDFNFLLHTLQSENRLNVLSRPHIVAMDNQEASIEVTDSIPYLSGSATTIGGSVQTVVSRQNVGIKLHVTPQINPDGFVRMEIRQEVSDLSTSTISVGPGVTAPIFNQRVAETVVTVQDNETVVLGGLIQTRDSRGEQKVPLVGDIPILGPLFRFQNEEQRRSELLVILTPRVIRTIEDYRQLSVQERDETGLLPDDVKTNPLMRNLRVRPVEPAPAEGGELLGPFEPSAPPQAPAPEEEPYGPVRPTNNNRREAASQPASESYDVPISLFSRKS